MFSFASEALQEIFAGTDVGVALSTAQRRADFVPQCLEQANYLDLPAQDREGVVNSCLQHVDSVR